MSELRVLHLSPTWFGDESVRGGGERFPLELAKAMLRRTPTRLAAFGGRPGTRRVEGFDIEVHRTWRRLRGRPYDAIGPGFLRALGWANIVHCHQARSGLAALAALIARPLGKRIFVTDHGGGGVNWVRRLRVGRWIDAQLAQSEFAAATLPYVGRRTEVIYAGVDTSKYRPGSRKTLGRVVYVGRILPHKGIETAIRGLPAGASLEIYGRPYDRAYLDFIRSEGASRPVRIHTEASDDEVIAALRSACAFVMPSVYEDYLGHQQALPELVGLAPLEAMACGTAAVVSNVAGMPEIIPRVGGATVPPGDPDSLRQVLAPFTSSVEHARAQGKAARAHVERRFTWTAVADRCLAAYTA